MDKQLVGEHIHHCKEKRIKPATGLPKPHNYKHWVLWIWIRVQMYYIILLSNFFSLYYPLSMIDQVIIMAELVYFTLMVNVPNLQLRV